MKMVKSLLLGSAAGLVAVAGAQAADLPVKAKPVQYVKICSLYGDGFYYIPGSDTCLKVFGYVRVAMSFNGHDNVPHYANPSGANVRHDQVNRWTTLARANLSADARTQTAYGTLRAYTSVHVENTAPDRHASAINEVDLTLQRAYIQWAGFTVGRVSSLGDVPGQMGDSGMRSLVQMQTESTTGASGMNEFAYTWQLGNGMNLNVGVRERLVRNIMLVDQRTAVLGSGDDPALLLEDPNGLYSAPRLGSSPGSSRNRTGQNDPSPFVSLHVNQAWGTAGVGVVAQKNRIMYFDDGTAGASGCTLWFDADDNARYNNTCGHPKDYWGYGFRAGAEIKLPMLGPGDRFLISGYWSKGAVRLAASNLDSPAIWSSSSLGFGWVADAVSKSPGFSDSGDGKVYLTTAKSINIGFEHYFTPAFSAAVYGGWAKISYPSAVKSMMSPRDEDAGTGPTYDNTSRFLFCERIRITAGNPQECDPGFTFTQIGGLVNWFPVSGFRLAANVVYSRVNPNMSGQMSVSSDPRNGRVTGLYNVKSMGTTTVMFRAQRSWGGD